MATSTDQPGDQQRDSDLLLPLFLEAQTREDIGDASATALYMQLVDAAEQCCRPEPTAVDDDALCRAEQPPASLLVAVALATLGASHLDAMQLEDARAAFLQSLKWWPANATALVKLGDMEHGRGNVTAALQYYERTASLPPFPEQSHDGEADGGPSAWAAAWAIDPRNEGVRLASYMCALLAHQRLDFEHAQEYLARFRGLQYRLSPEVWRCVARGPPARPPPKPKRRRGECDHYQSASPSSSSSQQQQQQKLDPTDASTVRLVAQSVSPSILSTLRSAFLPSAPFWKETRYQLKGASSFWYDVSTEPRNAIEALARRLLPSTGVAERIVGVEWWVHTRPEGRSVGHPLHFDTEEVTLMRGELLHPLVSSVTYVQGSEVAGDPTVILQQTAADDHASWAAVSHPKIGATLLFPGNLLHGVLPQPASSSQPGSRPAPSSHAAAGILSGGASGGGSGGGGGGGDGGHGERVTLMINFWHVPVHLACVRAPLDACGPLPRASRSCTWPRALAPLPAETDDRRASLVAAAAETPPPPLTILAVPRLDADPWERLPAPPAITTSSGKRGTAHGKSSSSRKVVGKAGAGTCVDAWAGRLELPTARNGRFFVPSLTGFLDQHV